MRITLDISRLNRLFKIDLSKFYLIEKQKICTMCLYIGILILYFGSLHPWFMWPLKELYPIPAALFLAVSYLVSNSMSQGIYCKNNYIVAINTIDHSKATDYDSFHIYGLDRDERDVVILIKDKNNNLL